jgi:hypothetical protein
MSEVIENGDAAAAVAAAAVATPASTLFFKGVLFLGLSFVCTGIATRFMLEASRAAAIEGAEIATLTRA